MSVTDDRALLCQRSFEMVPKARWLGTTWGLIGATASGVIYAGAALAVGFGTNGPRFGHDLAMGAFVGAGGLAGVLLGGIFGLMLPLPRQFFERRATGTTEPCAASASDVEELAGTLARSSGDQPAQQPLAEFVELTARAGDLIGGSGTRRGEDEARALLTELGVAPDERHGETTEGPIVADGGRAWALREGARVRLRSPVESTRREQGGAFRTAANRDLVPVGVLRLRVIGG